MANGTDTQFEQLKNLSKQLSANLFKVTVGAKEIIKTSTPGILSRFPFNLHPGYFQLVRFSFDWQIFMIRKSNKVFFGFRRKDKFDNSLRTNLSFSLLPVEQLPPGNKVKDLAYKWSPPAFIKLDPPSELAGHVMANGKNKPENVLWISDTENPDNILAICFNKPKRLPRSDIYFFKDNNTAGVKPVSAKKAPFKWYEMIFSAIMPWIERQYASPVPVKLDGSSPQIRDILQTLSENYVVSSQSVLKKQADALKKEDTPSALLDTPYQVSDYEANIILRLDKEDNLNTEDIIDIKGFDVDEDEELFDTDDPEMEAKGLFEEQELFQIGVNIRGLREEGRPVIRFSIYPPDFLTKGDMFEAFLDAFLEASRTSDKIAKHLNVTQTILEKALSTPGPGSFIFRIGKKGNRDIEVFVLRVNDGEKDQLIMFRANFLVDPSANRVIFKRKIKNLIDLKPSGEREMEHKGVDYMMRLLFQVNDWKNRVL